MKAWIYYDLNVRILKEDLPNLRRGETICMQVADFEKRDITLTLKLGRTIQREQMDLIEVPPCTKRQEVRGYNIILNPEIFEKHVAEVDQHPNTEDAPFWARGMQYRAKLDRIHIHYEVY